MIRFRPAFKRSVLIFHSRGFCQGDVRFTTKQVVAIDESERGLATVKNPWKQEIDPKGNGLTYYWNQDTNESTALGAPKPHHWVSKKV